MLFIYSKSTAVFRYSGRSSSCFLYTLYCTCLPEETGHRPLVPPHANTQTYISSTAEQKHRQRQPIINISTERPARVGFSCVLLLRCCTHVTSVFKRLQLQLSYIAVGSAELIAGWCAAYKQGWYTRALLYSSSVCLGTKRLESTRVCVFC